MEVSTRKLMQRSRHSLVLFLTVLFLAITQLLQFPLLNSAFPPERQYWDHPVVIEGSTNDTFGVCLLTFDDNHFLVEWLAFHYQTLPLRRLIVATDPRSRTSPSSILQRWKSRINITEWSDDDYFYRSYRSSILLSPRYPNATAKLVFMHRMRQRFFYKECLLQLQREGEEGYSTNASIASSAPMKKNWIALIDVDEFLFPNHNWKFEFLLPARGTAGVTIAQVLHRLRGYLNLQGPCLGLPRLLFGTKWGPYSLLGSSQSPDSLELLLETLDATKDPEILTLKWQWHEKLASYSSNKPGKALLDVSSTSSESIKLTQIDVHRPIMSICSSDNMWLKNQESPLVLHHYIGSFAQFTYRSDPRIAKRSRESYEEYQSVNEGKINQVDSQQWLLDFVESVGIENATNLLWSVGQLETNATPQLDMEASYQVLFDAILPGWNTKVTGR